MVVKRHLTLPEEQREELGAARDHDPHPQIRERAAAMLKIAAGEAPCAVAQRGLLRRRKPDTVYEWLNRYESEGMPGLRTHLQGGRPRGHLRRRADLGSGAAATGRGGSDRAGSA